MVKDPKAVVDEIAELVGKPEAKRLLINEGVSVSVSDKLVGRRYESEVGTLVRNAVLRALEKAKEQQSA